MITLLATGQSNMVGRHSGGSFNIPSSVTVWNNQNQLIDDTTGLGNAWVAPDKSQNPFTDNCNNLAVHAAKYISEETGEDVRLIIVAKGGAQLWQSSSPTGFMYARIRAVLNAAGVTSLDGVLWHQGETDDELDIEADYPAKWDDFLSGLETDGFITSTTPIVMGELAGKYYQMNAVLYGLEDSRTGLARIRSLLLKDDGHFNGNSLVYAGWQYAKEYLRLTGETFTENTDYVSAAGIGTPQLQYNTPSTITVRGDYGNRTLVNGGYFKVHKSGLWRFDATGYCPTSPWEMKLLDETGFMIRHMGKSQTSGIMTGSADAFVPEGEKVYLAIHHLNSSAGTVIVDAVGNTQYCRLSAQFMSE